jgi:hypothetical protein
VGLENLVFGLSAGPLDAIEWKPRGKPGPIPISVESLTSIPTQFPCNEITGTTEGNHTRSTSNTKEHTRQSLVMDRRYASKCLRVNKIPRYSILVLWLTPSVTRRSS